VWLYPGSRTPTGGRFALIRLFRDAHQFRFCSGPGYAVLFCQRLRRAGTLALTGWRNSSWHSTRYGQESLTLLFSAIRSVPFCCKCQTVLVEWAATERAFVWAILASQQISMDGPSGCGESTLFRAIAGISPYGAGEPSTFRTRQDRCSRRKKNYLPIDRLRAARVYPRRRPPIYSGIRH